MPLIDWINKTHNESNYNYVLNNGALHGILLYDYIIALYADIAVMMPVMPD